MDPHPTAFVFADRYLGSSVVGNFNEVTRLLEMPDRCKSAPSAFGNEGIEHVNGAQMSSRFRF